MPRFGGPIGEKYGGIDIEGRKALEKPETIKGFPHPNKAFEGVFWVSGDFDTESQAEVQRRILDRIEDLEAELGLPLLIGNRDFPLHVSLQNGVLGENDPRDKEVKVDHLMSNEELTEDTAPLVGLPVEFKYLLINRGNILLTSAKIPEAVSEARKAIAEVYASNGLTPGSYNYENILHITIARIAESPAVEDENPDKQNVLEAYRKRLIELRHEISSNPITMRIEKVARGVGERLYPSD